MLVTVGWVLGSAEGAEHRRLETVDATRDGRPVWIDVWLPASPRPAPVVLLSHGAMGAAMGLSGLASELAGRGYLVAGVNHYGESFVYGPDTVDPSNVLRMWLRPPDLSHALDVVLAELPDRADLERVAALGHSSGGHTAIAVAGGRMVTAALAAYCASAAAAADRG
ncbi:MAG: dienelactone hydrolase family protein, partial [Thermoanaerobaculia bacterium]|nr:dienelactone hydrolase family protein [Thermoanaerobaculia bacterium]